MDGAAPALPGYSSESLLIATATTSFCRAVCIWRTHSDSLQAYFPGGFFLPAQSLFLVCVFSDLKYSMGFSLDEDGKLSDVITGSPAYEAGIGPGMKLLAVNGRKWSPDAAIASGSSG